MFSVSSSFSHKIVKFHYISGKDVFTGLGANNDFVQYFLLQLFSLEKPLGFASGTKTTGIHYLGSPGFP